MKYSGLRKLLYEFSKLSKLNAFNFLGHQSNIDASILVYKFRLERTGFNMYAEYTQLQLAFLELVPCIFLSMYKYRSQFYSSYSYLNCEIPISPAYLDC